jgi:DNA-binding GntR family transcriptional regulator
LERDGRSLIVASLDHNQMAELYMVRRELEGLAASLAARHATDEELRVLKDMVREDDALVDMPTELAKANRRFHEQIHLASHNRYLVQQLNLVHRSMALMATTSLAAEGRGEIAQAEHKRIVDAIEARDEEAAGQALKDHISVAFMTRLKQDAGARGKGR